MQEYVRGNLHINCNDLILVPEVSVIRDAAWVMVVSLCLPFCSFSC